MSSLSMLRHATSCAANRKCPLGLEACSRACCVSSGTGSASSACSTVSPPCQASGPLRSVLSILCNLPGRVTPASSAPASSAHQQSSNGQTQVHICCSTRRYRALSQPTPAMPNTQSRQVSLPILRAICTQPRTADWAQSKRQSTGHSSKHAINSRPCTHPKHRASKACGESAG